MADLALDNRIRIITPGDIFMLKRFFLGVGLFSSGFIVRGAYYDVGRNFAFQK